MKQTSHESRYDNSMQEQSNAESERWEATKEKEVQHKKHTIIQLNLCKALLINWYYFPYRHRKARKKKPDQLQQHNRR